MRLNARTTVSVVIICFNIIRMALLYIIFTFTIIHLYHHSISKPCKKFIKKTVIYKFLYYYANNHVLFLTLYHSIITVIMLIYFAVILATSTSYSVFVVLKCLYCIVLCYYFVIF